MKITILAVGELKEAYHKAAFSEYAKRLGAFCKFAVHVCQDDKHLLTKWDDSAFAIVMDKSGVMFSSEQLAQTIQNKMCTGVSHIVFVIGGSHGLSETVVKRADLLLSFSRLTFAHQLFRVMLSEQIYRAFSIIHHLPYHK